MPQKDELIRSNNAQGFAFVVAKITIIEFQPIALKLEIMPSLYADFNDANTQATGLNAVASLSHVVYSAMKIERDNNNQSTLLSTLIHGINIFPKI